MESLNRREALKIAGLTGLSFLLPGFSRQTQLLASPGKGQSGFTPAESVIVLWLDGGASQLDTFDPKPGTKIGGGVKARKTSAKGVQIASDFEALADQMHHVSLIRSCISAEGDHQRGSYFLHTGHRPEPTVLHPTMGAILCQQRVNSGVEIPNHIAINSGERAPWGGFLGHNFDAFRIDDPAKPVPDILSPVSKERLDKRVRHLDLLERVFRRGRKRSVAATGHLDSISKARVMMNSKQVEAFDLSREAEAVRKAYGENTFGRGCLVARRLVEVGVRWTEVSLGGWDSHINNESLQRSAVQTLDAAMSSLIRELEERDLLRKTMIVCMTEFGRTPKINAAGGRDHWPHGFSVALAGGPIKGGQVIGETSPEGKKKVVDPQPIANVSATILTACGVQANKELIAPNARPIKFSDGKAIKKLLKTGS